MANVTAMRRAQAVLAAVALTVAGCGGDDDAEPATDDEQLLDDAGRDVGDLDVDDLGFDSDFDLSDLPGDFPDELVPPDWGAGQWTEIGGVESGGFLTSASFDDVADYYSDLYGRGTIVEGEERLGTWTLIGDDGQPTWVVGVFDDSPTLVTVTKAP